ncbi:MAG: DegV family protein [Halarsenatibacteraceae bacterium]
MNKEIVIDSACDLPENMIKNYRVLPFRIIINEQEYKDGKDININQVYKHIRNKDYPKTAQVSPVDFKNTFTELAKNNKDCLYIAFSAAMSGSYQTAKLMAQKVKAEYPNFNIEIVDSKAGSTALGLLVNYASKLLKQNLSVNKIAEILREKRNNLVHLFSLDNLTTLQKKGRLSKGKAFIGNLLNIKPILEVINGEIVLTKKVRGKQKTLNKIIKEMANKSKQLDKQIIGISHADDKELALELKDLIKEKYNPEDFMINLISPVLGAHLGIGGIGVFFFTEPPELI